MPKSLTDPHITHVGASDQELINNVIALGDQHSKTLGFLPHAVYEQAAATGTLIAIVFDDEVVAYALYSLPRLHVKVKQLCVDKQFRGFGLARLLIEYISEHHADRAGISLLCRSDYDENRMWPHLGFKAMGTKVGRSHDRKELTAWWLDHGHPDLFSASGSYSSLKVMLDSNVFADIESTYERREREESSALIDITLADQIELVVSGELAVEIRRLSDNSERAHQQKAARKYPVIRNDPQVVAKTAERFTALVAAAGGPDLSSTPNHVSDVRHLVEAHLAGVTVLATRDEEFTEWAASIVGETEVRVMRPSDVVLHVDALARAQEYKPAQLEHTRYTMARVTPGAEKELLTFLQAEAGERKSDYLARARNLLSLGQRINSTILRDPKGEPIAFFATKENGEEVTVPIIRIHSRRLEATIVRQILFYIRKQTISDGKCVMRITDPHLVPSTIQAMRDDGFIHHGDSWIGFTIACCGTAAEIDDRLSHYSGLVGLTLRPIGTGLSAPIAADLERHLWPTKVVDSKLPSFLLPVRPEWSTDLFGYPQGLFFRPDPLGISREHVYYRSPHPNREQAPARLLWYASGAEKRGGVGAVIACSRLEEVIVGRPIDLHRQFRHLGVWKQEQVVTAAPSGTARCLRFADTEIFPTPVPLERLRVLGHRHGQKFALQSPELVPQDLFADIYKEARFSNGRR